MDQLFDSMERLRIISPGNSPANEKLSFWDLGCGDGRVVVQACKRYSVQGIGIELDESLIKIAKELAQEAGVENNVDFRTTDLLLLSNPSDLQPQPDIIFIYLLPTALQRIQGLLERIMDELNTTVIIHLWPIVEWKSTRLVHVESDRFFVYQKPQQ
jgi:precorrin-6B methylase 2